MAIATTHRSGNHIKKPSMKRLLHWGTWSYCSGPGMCSLPTAVPLALLTYILSYDCGEKQNLYFWALVLQSQKQPECGFSSIFTFKLVYVLVIAGTTYLEHRTLALRECGKYCHFSPSPQEAGPPEGCWNGDLGPNRGRFHYHLHLETLSIRNAILFAVKTGIWTLNIGFLTTKLYLIRYNQFFFASYLFHLNSLHNLWSKVSYSENNDIESFAWNIWQNLHQMRLIGFFNPNIFSYSFLFNLTFVTI